MKPALIVAALCAAVLLLSPAVHAQEGFTVPQEWEGIWNLTITERTCGMQDDQTTMETDTLCAGFVDWDDWVADEAEVEVAVECTGDIGSTVADLSCTWEVTSEGITIVGVFETDFTRSGGAYAGTETMSLTFSGACDQLPGGCDPLNTCTEREITAIRTGPAPDGYCQTPVQELSWGSIKARYN